MKLIGSRFAAMMVLLPLLGLTANATSDSQRLPVTQQTPNQQVPVKHLIPSAVDVRITNRGALYFQNKLTSILGNIGVDLSEGNFDGQKFDSQESLNLDQLGLPQESADLVKKIRDLLTNWLIGFPLKDIRPGVQIGASGYSAVFNRFALVTDENLLHQLGKTDGAILAIELEMKELDINLSRVRAYDLDAPMLGQVGFDGVTAKVGGGQTPVRLRIPFYIRINDQQKLEFQALKMDENILQTDIELKYQKLVAPSIVLEVNGYRMEMNQAQLEKALQDQMPVILQKTRAFISDFAQNQLPALLNQKAKEALTGALEEVNKMDPPGATAGQVTQPFLWGLRLQKISQAQGLAVKLQGFVEDPLNPRLPLDVSMGSRGPVTLNSMADDQFDVAMSIDRLLINRILQLSFNRKFFEKIAVGTAGFLKLTAVPTVDAVSSAAGVNLNPGESLMKLHVQAQVPNGSVKGFNSLFLEDNFEVAFDLIAKLRKSTTNTGVEIVLAKIDTSNLWINPKDIKLAGRLVPGQVRSGVAGQLQSATADWGTKEQKLPGNLPLPPEILGIKLEIEKMLLDANGHLVMYLKYAQPPTAAGH